jgi:hypothetical protein
MRRTVRVLAVAAVAACLVGGIAVAQDIGPDDPGVRIEDDPQEGYLLIAPFEQQYTYLVDTDGRVAKHWRTSTRPGLSELLLEDGTLVRAGNLELRGTFARGQGAGGRLEALSWEGQELWQKDFADDQQMQHHEIEVLPNGNVLARVWELKSEAEALAAGRDPELLRDGELWPDKVIEYDPKTDEVVWEWHVWDHMVQDRDPALPNYVDDVSEHPDKIDINYVLNTDQGGADWNHFNAIGYNAERDEIVLSPRSFSELWVIDHGTTTEEAAGPAGDLKFRYGNPIAYGDKDGKRELFFQHDTEWIEPGLDGAGNILVFSNGAPDVREYSSVDEIVPELDADGNYVRDEENGGFKGKIKRVYPKNEDDDDGEFAAIVSGAQRLPNGNTLVGYGPQGRVIEVTPKGKVVWDFENPYAALRPTSPRNSGAGFPIDQNWFFQVSKYPPDFPGFAGREAQLQPPPTTTTSTPPTTRK